MKTIVLKKFVAATTFLILILFNLLSQNPKTYTPQERAAMQNEWMKENLHLSSIQYEEVSALNMEYALKMEKVKSVQGRNSQIYLAKSISDEKDAKLRLILSNKQFEIYMDKKMELRRKALKEYK